MNVREDYNAWSHTYDQQINPTRDLESATITELLADKHFEKTLELGCGTGKNTTFLSTISDTVLCVDLSENMMAKAKEKITDPKVSFQIADISQPWSFTNDKFDLISASLILEHIEHLDHVFQNAADSLIEGGLLYIGELHPFKQYSGSKARFQTEEGELAVACFTHHISEYINLSKASNFQCLKVLEKFDDPEKNNIPRIISFLFRKTKGSN